MTSKPEFTAIAKYHPRIAKDPYGRQLLKVDIGDVICTQGNDDRGWSTGFNVKEPAVVGLFPSACIARTPSAAANASRAERAQSAPLSTDAVRSNQYQSFTQAKGASPRAANQYAPAVRRQVPVRSKLNEHAASALRSRVTSPDVLSDAREIALADLVAPQKKPSGNSIANPGSDFGSTLDRYPAQVAPIEHVPSLGNMKLRGSRDDSDFDYGRRNRLTAESAERPTRPAPVVAQPPPVVAQQPVQPPLQQNQSTLFTETPASAVPARVAGNRRALGSSRDDFDVGIKPTRAAPVANVAAPATAPVANGGGLHPLPQPIPPQQQQQQQQMLAAHQYPPQVGAQPAGAPARRRNPLGQSRDDFAIDMRNNRVVETADAARQRKLPCPPAWIQPPRGQPNGDPKMPSRPAPIAMSPPRSPGHPMPPSPRQDHARQQLQQQQWQQQPQQQQWQQQPQQQWQQQPQQQHQHQPQQQWQQQQHHQQQQLQVPQQQWQPPQPPKQQQQQQQQHPRRRQLEESRDDSAVDYGRQRSLVYFRATAQYFPQQTGDIELQRDDIVLLVYQSSPEWWLGRNMRTQKVGVFPNRFVTPHHVQ